jgi:hypothetical protein
VKWWRKILCSEIWQVKNKSPQNIDPHFLFFLSHNFSISILLYKKSCKKCIFFVHFFCIQTQTRFASLIHVLNFFFSLFCFGSHTMLQRKSSFTNIFSYTLRLIKKYVKSTGRKWNIQDSYSLMQCQLIIFTWNLIWYLLFTYIFYKIHNLYIFVEKNVLAMHLSKSKAEK